MHTRPFFTIIDISKLEKMHTKHRLRASKSKKNYKFKNYTKLFAT